MTLKARQSLTDADRYAQIQIWLHQVLDVEFSVSVASADASFRRYFRVNLAKAVSGVNSMILMDAPPENEALSPFFEIATDWKKNAINTPAIYAKDTELGLMLMQDFGSRTFLQMVERVMPGRRLALYQKALEQLVDIQTQPAATESLFELPAYSSELLKRECELFREWYLGKHCRYKLSRAEDEYLNQLFDSLITSVREQQHVPVHRDYHSRNLMFLENQPLGIIDFQDAVFGPLYYDAVSLLKDCYIRLEAGERHELFSTYHESLQAMGLTQDNLKLAKTQFDLIGVQRHVKAIGIFCRLYHRDGKENYLLDIPRTAAYILELEQEYPQLQVLCHILNTTLSENIKN